MQCVGTFAEIYEEHKFIDEALFALFSALPGSWSKIASNSIKVTTKIAN